MPLLQGFRNATPLAGNWLRNAFEQLVEAETKVGHKLPQQELEEFVRRSGTVTAGQTPGL